MPAPVIGAVPGRTSRRYLLGLRRLADDELGVLAWRCDLVVDASDNFGTRYAINRACLCAGKPLVSSAAVRFEG
jgi:molybdopterin/thiamine biosynthesis adenylyltransferase